MKNVLIINGHPNPESYNYALAAAYQQGAATEQANLKTINITELEFDGNLRGGYQKEQALEPDLQQAMDAIEWADHLVWFFPMWWYGYPALMKGFIDRVFLPGFAFKYQENSPFPKQLLTGKTARVVITADSPGWYNRWIMGQPVINQFKKGTLMFCGIKPVKVTYIAPIRKSTLEFRQQWLEKVKGLGTQLA